MTKHAHLLIRESHDPFRPVYHRSTLTSAAPMATLGLPRSFPGSLRVDRDHRLASLEVGGHLGVDPTELAVPVGMLRPFLGLGVGLQAVAHVVQQLETM